jgi:DNA primase
MDQVSQIREKIDLVSFISEYVPLKKMGRNFKANCPFHNEKTPSFVVSSERQIWHCFGCGKGGDCFTFLMEYEHLEFVEVLRTLARRVGVELKETFDSKTYSKKEKIYNLNKVAAKFYNYILTKHETGKEAFNYLTEKRKITPALIETYQLGFSPTSSSSLSSYLINKKGYKKQDLFEAGLSFEYRGRIIDFFKGRLIFPLLDHRDNVVGFSGRILTDDKTIAKYINTKETEAYHKGDMFFGLGAAKEEIKKLDQAIIVEGEFDVISSFKEGIKNVVAVKGTALTENQVSLLSRFTKKVTLCLDQDTAGLEAMKRSLSILEKKGLLTTIVVPSGKDPDEALKKDPYEFKKAIKNEQPIYDFLMEKTIADVGKKDVLSKKKITDTLLPFISQISNEVIKEHYLKTLSREIDTSYESLLKEVDKLTSGKEKEKTTYLVKEKRNRREILEEYYLAVIIQSPNPKSVFKNGMSNLKNYKFENKSYEKIIFKLKTFFENIEEFDEKKFASALPEELLMSFDTCFLLPLPKFENNNEYNEEIVKVAVELLTIFTKDRIKAVSEQIKAEKNDADSKILKQELSELFSNLPKTVKP